jgi:hypothetical protein
MRSAGSPLSRPKAVVPSGATSIRPPCRGAIHTPRSAPRRIWNPAAVAVDGSGTAVMDMRSVDRRASTPSMRYNARSMRSDSHSVPPASAASSYVGAVGEPSARTTCAKGVRRNRSRPASVDAHNEPSSSSSRSCTTCPPRPPGNRGSTRPADHRSTPAPRSPMNTVPSGASTTLTPTTGRAPPGSRTGDQTPPRIRITPPLAAVDTQSAPSRDCRSGSAFRSPERPASPVGIWYRRMPRGVTCHTPSACVPTHMPSCVSGTMARIPVRGAPAGHAPRSNRPFTSLPAHWSPEESTTTQR